MQEPSAEPSTNIARATFRRFQSTWEESYLTAFVAIEPISGDYFFGPTLSEAIGESRTHYPDRLAHAFRVGHCAAVHFDMHLQ